MDENIIIQQIVSKDYPLVAGLINSLYKIKRPTKYYGDWLLSNGLFESVLMGAFNNGELIGLTGVQRKKLANNMVFGYLSWLNISPKWQGKGLFLRLGEKAMFYFKDLDFFCVIANSRAKVPCEHSLEFKIIGGIKMMVLSELGRIGYQDSSCEAIDKNTGFDFSSEMKEKHMFSYTPDYRRWRYALNPLYSYDLVKIDSGEFAVIKIFTDPVTEKKIGDIVDFECSLSNGNKLKELYLAACGQLKKKGAKRITTWALPDSELRKVIERIGFEENDYETYFGVKVLKQEFDFLYDFSSWHLRQADGTNF